VGAEFSGVHRFATLLKSIREVLYSCYVIRVYAALEGLGVLGATPLVLRRNLGLERVPGTLGGPTGPEPHEDVPHGAHPLEVPGGSCTLSRSTGTPFTLRQRSTKFSITV
jgi:hypothetical protein